jgi:hypothetical protein
MSRRRIQTIQIEGGKMGRRIVEEIKCDRCTRTEHVPTTSTDLQKKDSFFLGYCAGETLEYKDLCTACKEIITLHWGAMTRNLVKASPVHDRTARLAKISAAPKNPGVKTGLHGTSSRS